ncbi:MAG: ribosomal L7Ae/L30e/S12e/Gadd45 family protein [Firmicutes bacterium]|jgi:large subunit ribosomal protein L7A|nr:ribosomal L7Ae/L30e/S12e/Gadd45 family protein [Candidatus Fermentithermobacillaceae bacterium]
MSPAYEHVPRRRKVAGAKAVMKAISRGSVERVLVAKDADTKVLSDVINLAEKSDVEIYWVCSMKELGEYCGISVGASCCAILKNEG